MFLNKYYVSYYLYLFMPPYWICDIFIFSSVNFHKPKKSWVRPLYLRWCFYYADQFLGRDGKNRSRWQCYWVYDVIATVALGPFDSAVQNRHVQKDKKYTQKKIGSLIVFFFLRDFHFFTFYETKNEICD